MLKKNKSYYKLNYFYNTIFYQRYLTKYWIGRWAQKSYWALFSHAVLVGLKKEEETKKEGKEKRNVYVCAHKFHYLKSQPHHTSEEETLMTFWENNFLTMLSKRVFVFLVCLGVTLACRSKVDDEREPILSRHVSTIWNYFIFQGQIQ